jgi:hypothetical protein
MDAATKRIVDLVVRVVAEPLGEQQCEIKALRRELDHAKREIALLRSVAAAMCGGRHMSDLDRCRAQRNRE